MRQHRDSLDHLSTTLLDLLILVIFCMSLCNHFLIYRGEVERSMAKQSELKQSMKQSELKQSMK